MGGSLCIGSQGAYYKEFPSNIRVKVGFESVFYHIFDNIIHCRFQFPEDFLVCVSLSIFNFRI